MTSSKPILLHNVRNSVEKVSLNLDALGVSRLAWSRHTCRVVLGVEAGPAAVLRCALDYFTRHLEELLAGADEEQREATVRSLCAAARGSKDGIAAEDLLTCPPRPFSVIEDEQRAVRMQRAGEGVRALLDGPIPFAPCPDE